MIHGCVTLDEIFAAAGARAASLVPETSGYLALAVGDATSRLPFAIDDRVVMLTTEGNVGITKRGEMLPPRQAAAGLRSILTRLLAVSMGTAMPSLAMAGRPRDESDRGVDAVIEEIEAALIPVNRAAARRALARLARETIRAKEAGKVKRVRGQAAEAAKAQGEAPRPQAEAARAPVEAPRVVEVAPVARVATPRPPEVATLPKVALAPATELVMEATTPPPLDPPAASLSAPLIILPTPPPVPVMRAPTPPPPAAEPTPTLLGMGAVEVEGPPPEAVTEVGPTITVEETEPDDEENIETVQAPPVAALPAPAPRPALAAPITPPFALDVEPPPAPVREVEPRPFEARPFGSRFMPAPDTGSRADALLAQFGASCVDDARIADAAACLRRMAGVEATPAPAPVRVEAPPEPELEVRPARGPRPIDLDTPLPPRAGRSGSGLSFGLALAVLAVGIAGGGALVRLRPDLFGVAAPPRAETAKPAPLPAATVEPQGAAVPGWTPGGGARAERGSAERAR